jgi:hypothetical protein
MGKKSESIKGIELPYKVADAITLATLKETKKNIESLLKAHINKGEYMHEEDYTNHLQCLHSIIILIKYYGG